MGVIKGDTRSLDYAHIINLGRGAAGALIS